MMTITLTRTWMGMRTATRITQETFVEAGFASRTPSGMRMIPQYLNPDSVAVIASWDGEPIGAMVMVADGPFGLPSDRAFVEENDALRAAYPRLFEIGSFGVLAAHRSHMRDLANAAFAACFIVLADAGPGTFVVAAVEPKLVRFYDNLFGMSGLCDQERPMYGAPAGLCGQEIAHIEGVLAQPRGAQRRRIRELIGARDGWLIDERPRGGGIGGAGVGWPAPHVAELLAENDHLRRLRAQQRLLRGIVVPDGGTAAADRDVDGQVAVLRRLPVPDEADVDPMAYIGPFD